MTGADAATVEFLSFSIQQVGHPFKSTKTSLLSRAKRKVQPLETVDQSTEDTSKSVPFIYHKQKKKKETKKYRRARALEKKNNGLLTFKKMRILLINEVKKNSQTTRKITDYV